MRSLALFGPLLAPPDQARSRDPRPRREGAKEGDMQAIADALVQGSRPVETKDKAPGGGGVRARVADAPAPDGYARSCEALSEMQAADTSRIACPVLLVTGDEDAVAPPQPVRAIGDRIKGSRVEVLRGCGHWTP